MFYSVPLRQNNGVIATWEQTPSTNVMVISMTKPNHQPDSFGRIFSILELRKLCVLFYF